MKLPQPSPGEALSPRPKIFPKYLRRALYLNQNQGTTLIKLNVKRFHIREIIEILLDHDNNTTTCIKTHKNVPEEEAL